jgi:5-methylcytosine-specific restriction protein A
MHWPFKPQQLYNRRKHIHDPYKGQERSGIVTPKGVPGIFLFTGYGDPMITYYSDRYQDDGSLLYTGEGQRGDMQWKGGNTAVRDHVRDGRDILLFANEPGGVRFQGLFLCANWFFETQKDFDGNDRQAIVFHFVPLTSVEALEENPDQSPNRPKDLVELRQLALDAAGPPQQGKATLSTAYQRSAAVRDWVLARAGGRCEGCGEAAPFVTPAGRPYLEPHHIRRLSDGGPDHPAHVAGICPNCHRRAHFANDGQSFNDFLAVTVKAAEEKHARGLATQLAR